MKIQNWLFVLAQLCVSQTSLHSQAELPPAELPDIPRFYVDALCFESDEAGVSRLDVYVEVPYEALQFLKTGDDFRASYEVSINIYDTLEIPISEKWWVEKIEVNDFNQTVSRSMSNLNQRSFLLTPRSYNIIVQIKDRATDKYSRVKRKIVVRNFFDPKFTLSDLMLASRVENDSGKTVVYPNISGNVENMRDTFFLFFETYSSADIETVMTAVNILNVKGDLIRSDSFTTLVGAKKRSWFRKVVTTDLIAGDYILQVRAIPLHVDNQVNEEQIVASSSRPFVIRWRGLPVSITDLDLAIDQLEYVTDRETIDVLRKASREHKRELFQQFWKKKDPSPNTERNELMEEYYSRIAYANKNFGHYIDGWKTDMGMIYIIFGLPSNIERHPFDLDSKPYEIWTYYEISREFIFIDATGFGDYRLQNPLWELRRPRSR